MLTGPWSRNFHNFMYDLQCEHMIRPFKITNFHFEREFIQDSKTTSESRGERVELSVKFGNKRRTTTTTRKGVKDVNFCGQVQMRVLTDHPRKSKVVCKDCKTSQEIGKMSWLLGKGFKNGGQKRVVFEKCPIIPDQSFFDRFM